MVAKTYYKTGYIIAPNEIHALPDGLRMIAGDMHATGPQSSSVATWTCWGSTPDGNPSSIGSEIQPCVAGSKFLRMSVYFPQCWDGRLDSPDHMSHMAYPDPVAKQCPASHPTALPWVSYHLDYDIAGGVDTSHWRLSSDTYEPALPAGYSAHGDWFGGWDPAVKQTWTELCDRAAKDCQSHMLGDGREQYGEL